MAVNFELFDDWEEFEEEHIPPVLYIPNVVDVEFTGDCDFNCKNCWGTKEQDYDQELTVGQWIEIFENFNDLPDDYVDRVVITGGELLLRKDLGSFVCRLVEMEKSVTLSTTGIDYHHQLPDILGKLYSIGLPVDGPGPEINGLWRHNAKFPDGALSVSLDTLRFIQQKNPELQTAVRTLVHAGNVDMVPEIPKFLEQSGIDISRLRWILYELNIRKKQPDRYGRLVSTGAIATSKFGNEHFENVVKDAGDKFRDVTVRTIGNIAGRNFIINPSGESRAVVETTVPGELEEEEFGNLSTNFEGTIQLMNYDIKTLSKFSESARSFREEFHDTDDEDI